MTCWAMLFLAFFAVSMGGGVRLKLTLASRLSDRVELRLAAEAGARKGLAEVKKQDISDASDSFGEAWASNEALFKDMEIGPAVVSVSYGYIDDADGTTHLRYGIVDEERKINLNTAGFDVMKRLFKEALGMDDMEAQTLAFCIMDWRDADVSSQATGAEDNYYLGLARPYECKDAPLDLLDELLLVRSVTATIYEKLKDYVTVYGGGIVNINTAPKAVLLALGLHERLVNKILSYRRSEDSGGGTAEDHSFQDKAAIAAQLSQATPLDAEEVAQLSNAVADNLLGVSSRHFRIHAHARHKGKSDEWRVSCVFRRDELKEGAYRGKLVHWRVES